MHARFVGRKKHKPNRLFPIVLARLKYILYLLGRSNFCLSVSGQNLASYYYVTAMRSC
jgi:hypothetical protein